MEKEMSDVQTGFTKGQGIWDTIDDACCITEKAKEYQK